MKIAIASITATIVQPSTSTVHHQPTPRKATTRRRQLFLIQRRNHSFSAPPTSQYHSNSTPDQNIIVMASADAKIQSVAIPFLSINPCARVAHGRSNESNLTNNCLLYRELLTKPRNELTYVLSFCQHHLPRSPSSSRPPCCSQLLFFATQDHDACPAKPQS